MDKKALYQRADGVERLALLEDNELVELIERPMDEGAQVGGIYLGRVANVLPGMHSAFVDIGLDRTAFLSLDDLAIPEARDLSLPKPPTLKAGHELIVQIAKLPGGDKGAKLTACPTLAGAYLVLLPLIHHIGISRKITDDDQRDRLKTIAKSICPQGMGLIIRTAAEEASEDALRRDVDELATLWADIHKAAQFAKPPKLLRQPPSLIETALRDMDVGELMVEDAALMDDANPRIRLHRSETGLFALYRVDAQAEKRRNRIVYLPSGGTIIIDRTEAMTVIDVNSARSVGKGSLEDTILQTNLEAATEIAKQLRLRDIGGIIIIDFIDMEREENRQRLTEHLAEALQRDRAKTRLYGLTKLHLMEMTRKALSAPPPKPAKHRQANDKEHT